MRRRRGQRAQGGQFPLPRQGIVRFGQGIGQAPGFFRCSPHKGGDKNQRHGDRGPYPQAIDKGQCDPQRGLPRQGQMHKGQHCCGPHRQGGQRQGRAPRQDCCRNRDRGQQQQGKRVLQSTRETNQAGQLQKIKPQNQRCAPLAQSSGARRHQDQIRYRQRRGRQQTGQQGKGKFKRDGDNNDRQ